MFRELADEYRDRIRPLTQQYCLSCHSTEQQVGELDLEQFATLSDVRSGTKSWLKVIEMLDNGEMPPGFAQQPAPGQRRQLRDWVDRYLQAESLANAGDPGPVVLRRLNNAEYTYTIRDLTGVDLDPAREFPTDSAAGEGFTNTGNALVMSPALLRKYLDAGKEIAGHAVLLPDGFRFSPHSTRRDWTDEVLARIRGLYGEYVETADFGVGSAVGNLAVHSDTRIGLAGRLPLEKYLSRHSLGTGRSPQRPQERRDRRPGTGSERQVPGSALDPSCGRGVHSAAGPSPGGLAERRVGGRPVAGEPDPGLAERPLDLRPRGSHRTERGSLPLDGAGRPSGHSKADLLLRAAVRRRPQARGFRLFAGGGGCR